MSVTPFVNEGVTLDRVAQKLDRGIPVGFAYVAFRIADRHDLSAASGNFGSGTWRELALDRELLVEFFVPCFDLADEFGGFDTDITKSIRYALSES
ncbi:MAG: hypothetical protein NUV51_11755 [Sulfuricaulis sp.]|nr:hypothetical protein [Sulfuricaulis sp.]